MKLGNYELLFELASGGMGTVHVARHAGAAGFERLVVIKRVHKHLVEDPEFREMFRNEAKISAAIRHANVVPLIDVVESGSELFLVLEYVESVPLSHLIRSARERGEKLPANVVARILSDALAGLQAAHEAKDIRGKPLDLVHRDVSPQNVIVGVDGTSRLIDFGIAKAAALLSGTKSGEVKGKLAYFSPEQVRRAGIDRRADLFSAGAVLFEALTGKKLFRGADEGEVLLNILAAETPDLAAIDPSLPSELQGVLAKALEGDRERRFQTASEFRDALEAALPPATAKEVHRVVRGYVGEKLSARRIQLASHVSSRRSGEGGGVTLDTVDEFPDGKTIVDTSTPLPSELSPADPVGSENGVRVAPPKRRPLLLALSFSALAIAGAVAFGWPLIAEKPGEKGIPLANSASRVERTDFDAAIFEAASVSASGAHRAIAPPSPRGSGAGNEVPSASARGGAKPRVVGKGHPASTTDLHGSPYR